MHYERFEEEVLSHLAGEDAFVYRKFHCQDGSYSDAHCPAGGIRIVEGSYSLHPRFMAAWRRMGALTVFLSVDEKEQLRRIGERNPSLVDRFREQWIPMENAYFAAFHVARQADVRLESK